MARLEHRRIESNLNGPREASLESCSFESSLWPKRFLVVSGFFPYPPTNGYTMRVWALLRSLAANGHEIDLLSFGSPSVLDDRANDPICDVCRSVEIVPDGAPCPSSGMAAWRRLGALLSMSPYGAVRFRSRTMRARILARLQDHSVDAVLCEDPFPLAGFPALLPVPLIVDNQNVEHILFQRYFAHERNPARRAYAWLEAKKLCRWEQHAWSRADLVMVCSEHDRSAILKQYPSYPVTVAPNVIDIDDYTPTFNEDGAMVLYTGGMDWYPNRDAVEYFAFGILPDLRRLVPGVRFVVAGRSPSEKFRKRFVGLPGVEFTGTVPDMRTEIAKATVCVVPVRIGSGTRLKILEAAAMAKPIVSTRVGAEGLEFVDGREIVLADEPEAFARAVADLLTDASSRHDMGCAARQRVDVQYSLPVLRVALRQAFEELGEGTVSTGREATMRFLEGEARP